MRSAEGDAKPPGSTHGAFRPGDRCARIEMEFRDAREPLLKRDPNLHAGEIRSDAAVDAETESGVAVLTPIYDDATGIGKHRRISVGGRKRQQHHFAGPKRRAV